MLILFQILSFIIIRILAANRSAFLFHENADVTLEILELEYSLECYCGIARSSMGLRRESSAAAIA